MSSPIFPLHGTLKSAVKLAFRESLEGRKRGFLILFLFYSILCCSQNTGEIRFVVGPPNSKIRLDGNIIEQPAIKVEEGEHLIELWAPGMKTFKDTIYVAADTLIIYIKMLAKSDAYIKYEESYREYRKQRVSIILQKTSIIAFNSGLTSVLLANIPGNTRYHYDKAQEALELYTNAIQYYQVESAKDNYYYHKEKYEEGLEKRKKYLAIAVPSLCVSYAVSTYLWTRIKKTPEKPVFQESSPFSRLEMGFEITHHENLQCRGALSYRF